MGISHRTRNRRSRLKGGIALLAASAMIAPSGAQPVASPAPQGAAPRATLAQPAAPRQAAAAATAPCTRVEMGAPLQVSAGKSAVLRPGSAITRVVLGDPSGSGAAVPRDGGGKEERDQAAQLDQRQRPGVGAIDVLLLSPTEVYVLGKAVGTTNLVLLEQSGKCTAMDVVVTMDTGALQGVLAQLLPQEKDVRITAAFDSLVLSGSVSDGTAVSRVMELANAYVRGSGGGAAGSVTGANPRIVNMLSTGAPQQVMLEVKVAEVSKSILDQFGIDFSRAYAAGDGSMIRFLSGLFGGGAATLGQLSGTGGAGTPLSSVGAVVGGTIPSAIGSAGNVTQELTTVGGMLVPKYTTSFGTVPARSVTNASVNAQKTDGVVKVLAEPTVMAISGQKGSFLAGGKIFIPVAQDSGTGGRSVTLEEKEFGVSVAFLPTVLDGSRINLEVASEVSELNRDGIGISAPGINGLAILPSFTSRRAKTTVQLVDGQSFAIGGLIKNNTTSSVKAFPFLGEIPVLGALFRSTEFQSDKSELVFVITPRLVKPLPPNYTLPTDNYVPPSRTDLHIHGRLEGRRKEEAAPQAGEPAAAPAQPEPAAGGFQVK